MILHINQLLESRPGLLAVDREHEESSHSLHSSKLPSVANTVDMRREGSPLSVAATGSRQLFGIEKLWNNIKV